MNAASHLDSDPGFGTIPRMPNRAVPPVLTTTLLRGTPLVINRRRDTVVVTPPPGPVQNPSTPALEVNPSMPAPDLKLAELADWVRKQL